MKRLILPLIFVLLITGVILVSCGETEDETETLTETEEVTTEEKEEQKKSTTTKAPVTWQTAPTTTTTAPTTTTGKPVFTTKNIPTKPTSTTATTTTARPTPPEESKTPDLSDAPIVANPDSTSSEATNTTKSDSGSSNELEQMPLANVMSFLVSLLG